MTVLVIRPEPQASQLYLQLENRGVHTIIHPVIEFEVNHACNMLPMLLADSHIIIAVSVAAIDYAERYLKLIGKSWPSEPLYFAIGQKSAHHFSEVVQQKVHYPLIGDSEHLLELTELFDINAKNVTILRGDSGRELIFETLSFRGANVRYCETYQRNYIHFDAKVSVPFWQAQEVDSLVITSGGQLNYFVHCFGGSEQIWLFNLRLFVPSQRVANEAAQYGFTNIINVGSASNFDLLAAILP